MAVPDGLGGIAMALAIGAAGAFGGLGSLIDTKGCYYSNPQLVLEESCRGSDCASLISKHLPSCQRPVNLRLRKTIRSAEGSGTEKYLTYALMDEIVSCMSRLARTDISNRFRYRNIFDEVDYNVRTTNFVESEFCLDASCTRKGIKGEKKVIGQTKLLLKPF